ncbi:MAG: hypothetical protein MUP30_03115 [Deltaproteobacteria bacterium]|nr:hypothetical protein [Deltaproteobacteria bacterium]
MKKGIRSLGVLVILLIFPFLWGCPYESKVPLDRSCKAEIDPALLGVWKSTEKGESFQITIQLFNDHELLILGTEKGKTQPDAIRAFVTIIKDERFLNVQEIKDQPDKRGWWLVKYTISGETLTAWTVDDKLFTKPITSSRALYRFVKKNLGNKELYGDAKPTVLQRVKK